MGVGEWVTFTWMDDESGMDGVGWIGRLTCKSECRDVHLTRKERGTAGECHSLRGMHGDANGDTKGGSG